MFTLAIHILNHQNKASKAILFKEVEYMFLLAGKIIPGMERLQGEHWFIEEEGLLFPTLVYLRETKVPH